MKNKLNKVFSKITSCLLSMLMIVTCISVSTVVAEDSASDPTVITETAEVTTVSNEITGTEETQATTEQPAQEVKSEQPAVQVVETPEATVSEEKSETTDVEETPKTEETTTLEQSTVDTSNEEDKEDADVDTYAVVTADAGLATKEEAPTNDEIATIDEDVEETADLNNMSSDEIFNYLMSISAEEMEALYDLYDVDALTANFTEEQGNQLTAHFGGDEIEESKKGPNSHEEETDRSAVGTIIAQVVTSSDDRTFGKNVLKVRYEDEQGNAITLKGGVSTFTFNTDTISVNQGTFAQAEGVLDGYVFEKAYYYWSGHYEGTKYYATEFRNFGSKIRSDYNSYLGFKCSNTSGGDKDGYYAYNPTGVLHLVYKKVSKDNPYKIFYINEYKDFDEVESSAVWNGSTWDYYFKSTTKANPTKTDYTFVGWNTKQDGTGKWVSEYVEGETKITEDVYFYAIYAEDKDTFIIETLSDVKYNGTEQKQAPIIKNSKGEVVDNSNFDITYSADTKNVGTVTVTVTPKADSKFTGEATTSYKITKRSVTINAVAAKKVYGAENPNFTYELAEGSDEILGTDLGTITVSRTSNEENVKVYENDLVVNYKENTNYEVKTNKANFEITASDGLDIKAESKTKKYDGKALSVEAKSSVKDVTITYSTDNGETWSKDAPSITNAGSITVIAKASKENYKDVTVTYTLEVTKRNVTIESGSESREYNGKALTSGKITIGGKGFVKGEEVTFKATGTITNVGSTKNTIEVVKYSDKYNPDNYNLTFKEGTLEVKKSSDLKITVKDAKKEYDGTALTSVATSKIEDTTILYSIDGGKNWFKDAPSITDVDKVEVEVKATNPNYKDATASYKLEVTQREVTIKSNSDNKTYDGTPLTNKNYKITKGSFVKGEDVTIKTTGSITNVGKEDNTIEVTYGDNCKASNYKVTLKAGTLEVKAADFKVKNLTNVNYNGQEQKQEVVITDKNGNELSHDLFEIKYSGDTTNAGKVTVTVKAKKNTNYTGTKTESYDIEKLTLTVKTESASKTYDGSALTAGGTIEGLVNNETVTFTVTGSRTDVGSSKNTYEIKWNGTAKKDNYIIKDTCGKLTVNAAEFTVDDLDDVKYDGTTQKLLPVVKSGDKVLTNKKNYTLSYSGDTKNAGTVTVTVKGKGNYTGTVTKTYEITKRDVTITSASASKVYDGSALTNNEVTITGDGFVKGEASAKTTGTITNVGEAKNTIEITYGKNYKTDNYNLVINEGSLVVTKKSVTVTADNKEKTYGANDPDLTATVEGLVEGDSLNYSLNREEGEDAGEYVISVELSDNPNYEVEATSGYLTINPAEATITVNSYEKTKGESDPTLGATVTGTVNGESLEYTLSREEGEDVGEYTITAKLGENKNYKVTVVDGKLTIKEASSPTPAPTPDNNNDDNYEACPTGTYWNEATQSCVTRGRVNPTPTPDNGGSDDSTPTNDDTTPDIEPIDDNDTPEVNPTPVTPETIDDDDTPEKAKGSWALVNLLSVCVSFLLGIILLLSKNKKDDDEEEENNNDEANKTIRHKRWKVVAAVDAIAALIVFILTENMTLPMALVDKWTLLMLALVLVSVVSLLLGRKYHEDDSDEEAQNA